MNKYEILEKFFGYTEFLPGQAELIDAVLEKRDAMGVMPTGAGKSVCYQVPALMMNGITLVISPLISLMRDQVGALCQLGIRAAFINSSLTAAQQSLALSRAEQGAYKIIYVAPERLNTPRFLEFARNADISMVAVDEAHCVSQWGDDFRPQYLQISVFMEKLPKRPVFCAYTATATQRVRGDIVSILGLHEPYILVSSFDRPNLSFEVRRVPERTEETVDIVRRRDGRSGIIYCLTRKQVEELCEKLQDEGLPATRYHAGLSPEERKKNQDDFIFDRLPVMVATSAFGMGIDKSNVSYVVHFNMPASVEDYYQQAGRAGRDGSPAECILLYNGTDVRLNQFMIGKNDNELLDEEERAAVLEKARERLRQMTFYCTGEDCLRQFMLKYFGENAPDYCGNCGNCSSMMSVDVTTEAQMILSCAARMEQRGLLYGRKLLFEILSGERTDRVVSDGLDGLSTFGLMKEQLPKTVYRIIDQLVMLGYLKVTDREYGTYSLSASAVPVLKGQTRVTVKMPVSKKKTKTKAKTKTGTTTKTKGGVRTDKTAVFSAEANAADRKASSPAEESRKELLQALRDLRTDISCEIHVPAYMIFSHSSLAEMCEKLPRTPGEFRAINGVGDYKAENYADRFIAVIKGFVRDHPEILDGKNGKKDGK